MKLSASGYEVLTAEDGSSAIALIRQQRPDVILLDINFPVDASYGGGVVWDGFLILDWLRRLDEGRNIPVIMITGDDPEKHKERAWAAGAVSMFHKPVSPEEVLLEIERVLGSEVPEPPGPA